MSAALRGAARRAKRAQDGRLSLAWHVEAFARTKRLPKLGDLVSAGPARKRPARQSAEEMAAVALRWHRALTKPGA